MSRGTSCRVPLSFVMVVLGAVLACPAAAQCIEDGFEPDDSCAASVPILHGATPQSHEFCDDGEDWIRFNACAGLAYVLTTIDTGPLADTSLELFGPGCDSLLATADESGPGSGETLEWLASDDGTYYLRVRQSDGTSGTNRDYQLSVEGDTSSCATWSHLLRGAEDESFRSVVPLEDGRFLFGGTTVSGGAGAEDLLLAEYDPEGYLVRQWTVGSSLGETGRRMEGTPDGGFLLVGWIQDSGAPDPETTRDGLAVKLDPDANLEWAERLGGRERDELHGVAVLADGSAVAVGETESAGGPAGTRAWAIRLNADGTVAWSSTYGGAGDNFADVRSLRDGGFVAAGSSDGDRGRVVRFDSSGSVVWSNKITYASGPAQTHGYAVAEADDGGVAAGGLSVLSPYEEVSWIVRLDANGAYVWDSVLVYPSLPPNRTAVHSLRATPDGGLLAGMLAGYASRWPTLAKLDPEGALEWSWHYQPSEWAELGEIVDVEPIPGGGYVAACSPIEAGLGVFNASGFVTGPLGTVEGCSTFRGTELSVSSFDSVSLLGDGPKRGTLNVTPESVALAIAESALPSDFECRTCVAPGYHGALQATAIGDETTVTWTLGSAGSFDVVRGDLDVLLSTGGDYDAAMSQPVADCLANDTSGTEVTVTYPSPDPGEGYFYLLRPVKMGCPVAGTYDTGSTGQVGVRDQEVAGGLWSCP